MTINEITVIIAFVIFATIVGFTLFLFASALDKSRKKIELLTRKCEMQDIRIDGIVDRLDFLVQIISNQFEELKKDIVKIESEGKVDKKEVEDADSN